MTLAYAATTDVPVERSKSELDGLLRKHGATQRVFADDDDKGVAVVCFTFGSDKSRRQYRLEIPLPKWETFADGAVKARDVRNSGADQVRRKRHEQACRARWRAIVLLVKAKLELIALGVSSVEREFLADLVLAEGQTVHQVIADKVAQTYLDGQVRPLLLGTGTP